MSSLLSTNANSLMDHLVDVNREFHPLFEPSEAVFSWPVAEHLLKECPTGSRRGMKCFHLFRAQERGIAGL